MASASPSPVEGALEPQQPCQAWQVEYVLAANLTLTNTPHGAGNGTFTVGPGRAVILYEDRDGQPGGNTQLLGYTMREQFSVRPRTIFGGADIQTDLTTRTAEGCGVGHGVRNGETLTWTSTIRDYHTDGTIHCEGSLCGRFQAPPPGESEFRVGSQDVRFSPFTFSPDGSTFTMPKTFVEKSEDPKQTAFVALSGREVRRQCVAASTCK
jgi:hypothetical protein